MKKQNTNIMTGIGSVLGAIVLGIASPRSSKAEDLSHIGRDRPTVELGLAHYNEPGASARGYLPFGEGFFLDGRVSSPNEVQSMIGLGYNHSFSDAVGANIFADAGHVNGLGIGVERQRPNLSVYLNGYFGDNGEKSHVAADTEIVRYFSLSNRLNLNGFVGGTIAKPDDGDLEHNLSAGAGIDFSLGNNWTIGGEARIDSSGVYSYDSENDGPIISGNIRLAKIFGEGDSINRAIRRRQPAFYSAEVSQSTIEEVFQEKDTTQEPKDPEDPVVINPGDGNPVGNDGPIINPGDGGHSGD